MIIYIGVGVVAFVGVWLIVSFNRFVSQRHLIANSWSNVETELRRRYDLVPNLVETVRGYAAHESTTFAEITEARMQAMARTGSATDQAPTENMLVAGLRQLMAVSEAYPDLRASRHFLELQRELVVTEDRIQAARRLYNGNVRDYNRRVESVPSNLVARAGRFERAAFFEIEAAIRTGDAPSVSR